MPDIFDLLSKKNYGDNGCSQITSGFAHEVILRNGELLLDAERCVSDNIAFIRRNFRAGEKSQDNFDGNVVSVRGPTEVSRANYISLSKEIAGELFGGAGYANEEIFIASIQNLMRNSFEHSESSTPPTISYIATDYNASVSIADSGKGFFGSFEEFIPDILSHIGQENTEINRDAYATCLAMERFTSTNVSGGDRENRGHGLYDYKRCSVATNVISGRFIYHEHIHPSTTTPANERIFPRYYENSIKSCKIRNKNPDALKAAREVVGARRDGVIIETFYNLKHLKDILDFSGDTPIFEEESCRLLETYGPSVEKLIGVPDV